MRGPAPTPFWPIPTRAFLRPGERRRSRTTGTIAPRAAPAREAWIPAVRVGVLGGGQLGRMLALEGIPLGCRFTFLEPAPDPPAAPVGDVVAAPYDDPDGLARIAAQCDVATYEFENVPARSADFLAARLPALPPPGALQVAQDRVAEKTMFRELGIGTPAFRAIDRLDDVERALAATGVPAVIKTRRLGYDGKGQSVVRSRDEAAATVERLAGGRPAGAPDTAPLGLVAEAFVSFDRELSVLAAQGRDGSRVFYPLTENRHVGGILRMSLAPAPDLSRELQAEAEDLAAKVLDRLKYVGVVAIELFEVRGRLLANEMAPRVHNSGHWTLDGASASQFENHVRAVAGLPLAVPRTPGPAAMINLIGRLPDMRAIASLPYARLHLYDKAPRPGRKLGHVNVTGEDEEGVADAAARIWKLLPDAGRLPPAAARH